MNTLLPIAVVVPAAAVVVALSIVLWRSATSQTDRKTAIAAAVALTLWGFTSATFANLGLFRPKTVNSVPPIGIFLAVALFLIASSLVAFPSLRRILMDQTNLTRLHVWRLEGIVFLLLMTFGQMPALWALPAGVGDILVGSSAFRVARSLNGPSGRRRAIVFNLLGMADLILAVGLGITTNPGRLNLFHTVPTSALITGFPLALVPTFLVPLAFTIHVVSLWQLLSSKWAQPLPEEKQAAHLKHLAGAF